MSLTIDGTVKPYDGDLTFMGNVLAELPVDVRVGKLLVLGHIFGCLEECLVIGTVIYYICIYCIDTVGAALSLKSIFTHPYHDDILRAYRYKILPSTCFA